jgi:hypothetical protein
MIEELHKYFQKLVQCPILKTLFCQELSGSDIKIVESTTLTVSPPTEKVQDVNIAL